MERRMELMVDRLDKRLRCMEQSIEGKIAIIADKVDALVAALSHCGISSEPTFSGLLAAAEVTQGSRAPCVAPAMPHEKAVISGM